MYPGRAQHSTPTGGLRSLGSESEDCFSGALVWWRDLNVVQAFNLFVTDAPPPAELAQALEAANVELMVALDRVVECEILGIRGGQRDVCQ
jgi:hypothetical protein